VFEVPEYPLRALEEILEEIELLRASPNMLGAGVAAHHSPRLLKLKKNSSKAKVRLFAITCPLEVLAS
jgi:hypothetical protein